MQKTQHSSLHPVPKKKQHESVQDLFNKLDSLVLSYRAEYKLDAVALVILLHRCSCPQKKERDALAGISLLTSVSHDTNSHKTNLK